MTPRPEPIDAIPDLEPRDHTAIGPDMGQLAPFIPADPAAFAHLDLAWYDRVRRRFEAYGFRHLGDYDAPADACDHTWQPLLVRALVSRDGTVTVSLSAPQLQGFARRVTHTLLGTLPRPVVACTTACTDGTLVHTSNGPADGAPSLPSLRDVRWLAPRTSPEDVYATHTARVTAHLRARPGVRPLVVRTADAWWASEARRRGR
ncbi:MAG: hypothetical protein K2R93_02500 [Gemmatimonadaceae bacterium]|nr:hypothetical protein [Gemmatimonadaceae bacterium]